MLRILILALAFTGPPDAGEQLQFTVAPATTENNIFRIALRGGQHEIFASGELDANAADRFQEFVKEHEITDAIVFFDSPGGSLSAGIALGKVIRSFGFNTGIGTYAPTGERLAYGMCASSCAYAFAGGRYRFYGGGEEKLGIHQFYSSQNNQADMGDTQIVSSILVSYLQFMGVDPQAFVLASATRGNSMSWLTPSQAITLGLSNNGANPTSVEIKMAGSNPYLKLEQEQSDVTARVLFGCHKNRITVQAGIVTTPELSELKRSGLVRTYLETGAGELLVANGEAGTEVVDSVLWLQRIPTEKDLLSILKANNLGIWTENGGPIRWGATIDLNPAKEKMLYFTTNCLQLAP